MPEQTPATDPGGKKNRKKVSAVISAGVERLEHALRRRETVWPPRGRPHDGVPPGAWRETSPLDETSCLPEDCPVQPLGYDGENYYFVDTSGQVFNTGTSALGVERMQKLFAGQEGFLDWAWPSWNRSGKLVTGFKAEEARRDLYAACRRRGPWSPTDRVRGRGAWLTNDGTLILHCGEVLWVQGPKGGRFEDTGEMGEHFYVRRPASTVPQTMEVEDVDDNPAIEIFRALRTWNMERQDVDRMLMLGAIGVAMMGAALDWRPSLFVVGDAGMGKSELTGKTGLLRAVLGRSMIATTNATEAGLYQVVGHDSLPIAIDELEGDEGIEQAQKIIKMARDAASGSVRIRGGQDHKGVEFQAQSIFFFSGTNPPPLPPASLSRLAIVQLNPFVNPDPAGAPKLKAPETVGPRLLRRIADHFRDFPKIFAEYQKVLAANGHNARGQKTFGTFLAAAHLLLGDEGMEALGLPFEQLDHWGAMLAADAVPELENAKPMWLDVVERVMTRPIDAYRDGTKPTIARLIDDYLEGEKTLAAANTIAAAVDVALLPDGFGDDAKGIVLAIPNQSDVLAKHLAGTPYAAHGASAGSWHWALKRAPEGIRVPGLDTRGDGRPDNRISIAGLQRRCTLIRLREVRAWLKNHG